MTIQKVLGHYRLESTMRYAALADVQVFDDFRVVSERLQPMGERLERAVPDPVRLWKVRSVHRGRTGWRRPWALCL